MLTLLKNKICNDQKLRQSFANIKCLIIIENLSCICMIITFIFSYFIWFGIFVYTLLSSFLVSTSIQNKRSKSSKQELEFLKYLKDKHDLYIECDDNKGQRKILTYSVDGFVKSLNLVIEYNGCYFHGHNCTSHNYNKKKLDETINREIKIRGEGYNLICIWECEWINQNARKLTQIDDDINKLKSIQQFQIKLYYKFTFYIDLCITTTKYFFKLFVLVFQLFQFQM